MKKIIAVLCLCATPAAAQYYGNDPFWNNYYAGLANNGMANSIARTQQRRANEAMINLERRRQGLPPCTLVPLGPALWGMPAC